MKPSLSRPAKRVARHLMLGWGCEQIAVELGLSTHRVRGISSELMDGMGAGSRTELVVMILHDQDWLRAIYES